jgi:hypothetical protein
MLLITHLRLPLDQGEYEALTQIADEELRSPADQVRYILRKELERRRLIRSTVSVLAQSEFEVWNANQNEAS